ncbi:MAG TPA: hypothetical protein VNA57_13440 [Acidimicrobiales bacterium]|nr:hypothetical protein [Acidimicrobiales bacterium]
MTTPASVPQVTDSEAEPCRSRRPVPIMLVMFVPVALLNIVWFSSFSGQTLMGDDLDLVIQSRTPGGYASNFFDAFTQTGSDKFRPVVTPVLSVITDIFGSSFPSYRNLNLAVQVINVGLVGLLAWRISRRNWLVAFIAMTLVSVSRFNVYFVLQIYGLMEGLAVTFILGMLMAVHANYERHDRRFLVIANVCYFLVVFTHERFIVLAPFLVVTTLQASGTFRSLGERIRWATIPLGVAGFNLAVKVYVLGIDFFTGPGGQSVDFGPNQVMVFIGRAVLNLLGFNTGPAYLTGRNAHGLGFLGVGLCAFFASAVGVLVVVLVLQWVRAGRDRQRAARAWLLGGSLIGPLLLSASITFRQEFRWLYAPYIVLIIGVSWALGRVAPRSQVQVVLALAVLVAGLTVDVYYRRFVENTYFFSGLRFADNVRRDVIDRHRHELKSSTVFLVTHGDPVVDGFFLHGGGFFDVYAPGADVRLVMSLEAAAAADQLRPRLLAFEVQGDFVIDVTSQLGPIEDRPVAAEER